MTYDYNKRSEIKAYDVAREQVSKTRQIVMLYDGIISFLLRSKEAMLKKNHQDQFNHIDNASKIVSGLLLSLDDENGGEVAKTLRNYYSDIFMRIMRIIPARSEEAYDLVIEDVRKMREAWEQIDQEYAAKNADGSVSAANPAPTEAEINQAIENAMPEGISLSA